MKIVQKRVVKSDTPAAATPCLDKERIPWQRITISLIGIFITSLMWKWSVNHLYSLPPATLGAFTTITTSTMYVLGALVIWFVTGRLVYEWKLGTAQTITEAATYAESVVEKRTAKSKYFDDPEVP